MAGKVTKIVIVAVLIAAVCGIILYKHIRSTDLSLDNTQVTTNVKPQRINKALPRLVDLGADKCIPCKMMAPILEELKKEYAGRLEVEFIDVWKNPDEAKKYKINIIPTQIFYDAKGKETFRHSGFFSDIDIVTKLSEMGIK